MNKSISLFLLLGILAAGVHPQTALACENETSQDSSQESTQTVQYSTHIRLSEVYPSPADDAEEFIELENTGESEVDLSSWQLADASGKKYTIATEDFVNTTVGPNQFFVIPYSASKIYLNNSGDSVLLYNPDGTVQDETTYDAADEGVSWSFVSGAWTWSQVTEGKKNIALDHADDETTNADENTTAANDDEQQTSSDIFLNELIPNPSGSDTTDEWIEIVNTGSETVNLSGWQLTDQASYFTIGNVRIGANEYLVFEIEETGLTLNNAGDTVYIIDPFNAIVNGTTYADSPEGSSWSRFEEEWNWTEELTPGDENARSEQAEDDENDEDAAAISTFRTLEDGDSAVVEGVVTVLPGILGSQYFYIQDESSGLQVYSYSKAFPELSVGDTVRVIGEKSSTHNEVRIKTAAAEDILVLSSGNNIAPAEVDELEEGMEGTLVQVEGQVVESSSTEALINGLVAVVFKSGAAIDSSILEEGSEATVVGVVSQYDDEYRMLPRGNEDIVVISAEESTFIKTAEAASPTALPASTTAVGEGAKQAGVFVAVILGLLAIIAGLFWRGHKKQILKWAEGDTHASPAPETVINVPTIFDQLKKRK